MSASGETLAVGRPRRVWKIVAAVVVGIAALPVAMGIGSWAANELATPSKGTVSSTVKN